jgi:hypothetical protein
MVQGSSENVKEVVAVFIAAPSEILPSAAHPFFLFPATVPGIFVQFAFHVVQHVNRKAFFVVESSVTLERSSGSTTNP